MYFLTASVKAQGLRGLQMCIVVHGVVEPQKFSKLQNGHGMGLWLEFSEMLYCLIGSDELSRALACLCGVTKPHRM